jgi:putative endonuclease
MPKFYVYIMTNEYNTVLYTGVTKHLKQRSFEHKSATVGFTAEYKIRKLVYFTEFDTIDAAIAEEKRIKGGSRKQKVQLVKGMNPLWQDLTGSIKQ